MARRLARLAWLAASMAAAGCLAPDVDEGEESALPLRGFEAYTGSEEVAGDYYVAVTEWQEPGSGKTVVLVPMVHVADQGFYAEVQRIRDGADVVLTEGIGEDDSLSPTSLLYSYFFSNYSRLAWHGALAQQSLAQRARATDFNADFDRTEFAARMPWWSPVTNTLLLPLFVLVLEPLNLCGWTTSFVRGDASERALRHHFACVLADDPDEPEPADDSGDLIPTFVAARNARLLERADGWLARPEVLRIVVPWGAAHVPGIAEGLEARGFTEVSRRWVRAIAVRSWPIDEHRDDDVHFMVPFLLDVDHAGSQWSCGLACDAVAVGGREAGGFDLSLLWGLLLRAERNPPVEAASFSLLPSLFGRPLLFEWTATRDGSRWRFLWFFEIGG